MELNSPTITSQHLVCTDLYCPKATDAFTNRVICRCYQTTHGQMPFSPNFAAALFHTPIPGEIPSPVTSPMQANSGLRWDNAAVSSLGFGSPFLSAPHQNIDMFRTQMYNYLHSAVDPNNGRRKNATRETTTALKAWLKEHRKNPYPTKAEKIMLAIITRMTLTQVSTWFANARRRLKKENKGEFSSDISFDDLSTSSDDEDSTKSDSLYKTDRIYSTDTTTPEHELPGYSSMSSNIYNCGSFTFRPLTSTPIDHNMNNLPAYTKPEIKMENDNSVNSNVDKIVEDGDHTGQANNKKDQNDTKLTDNNSESSTAPTRPRFLPPLISKPKIWSISNIIGNDDGDRNLDNNFNKPISDSEICEK